MKIAILSTTLLMFVLAIGSPALSYDGSCARRAKRLERNANEYESAKSTFESACSDWGYSRDDESACGPYGYERSALESARNDLEYAISRAARSCGFPASPHVAAVHRACQATVVEVQAKLDACLAKTK